MATFPIRAKPTPDGKRVLGPAVQAGDLAVLDAKERKIERRIPVPPGAPVGIVIAPDGKRAYVAHAEGDSITILDLQEWKPAGTLTVGKGPDGMAYSAAEVSRKPA